MSAANDNDLEPIEASDIDDFGENVASPNIR